MADSTPTEERDGQKDKTRGRVVAAARGIAYVPLGVVVALLRDWYANPNSSTRKKGLARALALILAGGVAGAAGIHFAWKARRNARRAREEALRNAQEQLEDARRDLRLARRGQITERFTRAVDQLGARDGRRGKALEARLGGIYALERIAKESPECYAPVVAILTAYVREHAPSGASEDEGRPPSPDIQAILAVLGRLVPDSRGEKAGLIDLRDTFLRRADLRGADLRGAVLYGADLTGADLTGADLTGADLREADLTEAVLNSADLTGADLRGTILPDGSTTHY